MKKILLISVASILSACADVHSYTPSYGIPAPAPHTYYHPSNNYQQPNYNNHNYQQPNYNQSSSHKHHDKKEHHDNGKHKGQNKHHDDD